MPSPAVSFLRKVSLAEAVSYLFLLGVAMPLKYLADMPMAVKIAGSIHGGLFLLLIAALGWVWFSRAWPVARLALVFAASFVPLVPFFLDRKLAEWDRASSLE